MDAQNKVVDKAIKACSPPTARALSEFLGVTESAVSNWRNGRALPDPVSCDKIARLTGESLAHVLGVVGEARAISSAEKAVWRKLAAAACLVLAFGQAGLAKATSGIDATSHNVYTRIRQTLTRLLNRDAGRPFAVA